MKSIIFKLFLRGMLVLILIHFSTEVLAKKKTTISDPPPDEEIEDIITV